MADSSMKARRVRVRLEEGKTGLFYATSPDLKGLLVAEPSVDAVVKAVPGAIAEMYKACGLKVVVTKLDDDDGPDDFRSWVAISAEIARKALEENRA